MSDMYLELKSRIPLVAARTHLGSARIQEAQDAKGLSNERIARLIPVSEKTWRRWKEAGEIPTAALPAVARALGLEIRGATVATLDIEPAADQGEMAAMRAELAEVREMVAQLLQQQTENLKRQAPGQGSRGASQA